MRARWSAWAVTFASMFVGACGSSSAASKPVVEFPSREVLSQIAARPAPQASGQPPMDSGDGFRVEAMPPVRLAARMRAPSTPWEQMLARAIAGAPDSRLTEEMHCAAAEMGRFYLERSAYPGNELRQFILARCGATVPDAVPIAAKTEVPASVGDGEVFERWSPALEPGLRQLSGTARRDVGVWFGREGDSAVVMLLGAERRVELAALDAVPDAAGQVRIEGKLLEPADALVAFINRGRYGAARCELDIGLKLPAFRLLCGMAPDDASAQVELFARPAGRFLAFPVARLLSRRPEVELPVFGLSVDGEPQPVASADSFGARLLPLLNRIREAAGARPVALAPRQSQRAGELMPHLLAAGLQRDEQTSDQIALGLMAGWEVEGMIRDASFLCTVVAPERDAASWLGAVLSSPSGRAALLDPEVETIAVGARVSEQPGALAAVVTSYRFHHEADHEREVNALFTRIVHARERLGLSAPKRLGPLMEPMQRQLGEVRAGKKSPHDALDQVLHDAVYDLNRAMRGYQLEAIDLAAVEIPDEIIRADQLFLEIGVTHYRAPGAAWGQLVVLIAYVDGKGA